MTRSLLDRFSRVYGPSHPITSFTPLLHLVFFNNDVFIKVIQTREVFITLTLRRR